MNSTIVTVALFGLANLGALIFAFGDIKARVKNLESWKEKAGSEIGEVRDRVSTLEGRFQA
jgi:hypothetical protein